MSTIEKFSPTTAAAIVIANMIGTGVFTSLGYQLVDIQSGFVLLMLWLLGGIVAICGALCYAELGARLPRSGGEYNFLSTIYHPMAGFISGCVSATVGFAAPTALAAITFGSYLASVFPQWPPLLLGSLLVIVITVVHASSHRNSASLQRFFTLAKIIVIIGFSAAALFFVEQVQPITFAPKAADVPLMGSGAFAVALIYVGYAYSGWNAATYLSGELKNPGKTLPMVLAAGTGVVMLSYLLLNFVFLSVAPVSAMTGKIEIGYIAAQYAFGDIGAAIMGITLALLLVSTVSAMIIAAPRVLQVVGEDFHALRFLGKLNKHNIPAVAVYFQGATALAFMWTASFDSILIFSGVTMALNTLFAVFGVFILRHRDKKQPNAEQPLFRIPWYPLPPILFIGVTSWTLIYLAIERPVEVLFSAAVVLIGAAGYLVARRYQQ